MAIFYGTRGVDIMVGTNGSDVISGGNGDDLLVGDKFLFNPPNEISPTIGNDVIYGGAGNDIIVGDIQIYSGLLDSYSDLSSPYVPTWFNGNAGLYGGSGGDSIFGVYQVGIFTASTITLDFGPQPIPTPQTAPQPMEFLYGEQGNDLLVGNAGYGANIFDDHAYIINMFVEHLSSYLDGGAGDDILSGGCLISVITAQNGSTGDKTTLNFESSKLIGGNGNDILYGSDKEYNIIISNNSHFTNFKTVFGGDIMDGGNGMDAIYGDVGILKIDIDNTSSLDGVLQLGGDHIDGGNGNDTIFGDVGSFDLHGITLAQLGNMITTSQGDTINGGNGTDFIAGQFGNDVLTGGQGPDTFAYFSQITNGNDIITDFNIMKDALQGDHAGMFSDGGHDSSGNLIINIADATGHSTITLLGVSDFSNVHTFIV